MAKKRPKIKAIKDTIKRDIPKYSKSKLHFLLSRFINLKLTAATIILTITMTIQTILEKDASCNPNSIAEGKMLSTVVPSFWQITSIASTLIFHLSERKLRFIVLLRHILHFRHRRRRLRLNNFRVVRDVPFPHIRRSDKILNVERFL